MLSDGKDFNMSLVVRMGFCIEVVGEEGQGAVLFCLTMLDLQELQMKQSLCQWRPSKEMNLVPPIPAAVSVTCNMRTVWSLTHATATVRATATVTITATAMTSTATSTVTMTATSTALHLQNDQRQGHAQQR